MSELLDVMAAFFKENGSGRTYWLAFSGGLDSTVLLSLCSKLQARFSLRIHAVHVNHQVSPNAADWVLACQNLCLQNNIQFTDKTIEITNKTKQGFEEEARDKRYQVLAAMMQSRDILLTAHHQDDQAETLLLQLLRGAGTKGLAAMPAQKVFAQGSHMRPLLNVARKDLVTYAEQEQLTWIEDESNQDVQFARNYLRQEIIPLLAERYPAVVINLARSAGHIAEAQDLLEEYALILLNNTKGKKENTLSVSKLNSLHAKQHRLVLRTWLQQQGYLLPDTKKLQVICHTMLTAAPDRFPCVLLDEDHHLRRFRDELSIENEHAMPIAEAFAASWQINEVLELPGIGKLSASLQLGQGLSPRFQQVTVRFRSGGEILAFSNCHRTLKNLLQEWGVPIWERQRLPLIYIEDQLVCVVGHFIDARYQAKAEEKGFVPLLDVLF